MTKTASIVLAFVCLLGNAWVQPAGSALSKGPPPAPPTDVMTVDTPNDAGHSITVSWKLPPDDAKGSDLVLKYVVLRSDQSGGQYEEVGSVGKGLDRYVDEAVPRNGVDYFYVVRTVGVNGAAFSVSSPPARASEQWFNTMRVNALIGTALFVMVVLLFIQRAKKGRLFIRRITGLSAVDEAVGRATEMGRPILYVPGTSTMSDVATIAGLNILNQVAKKTAEYGTPLIVPNKDPVVYTVAQEMVKEAYTEVGRPDAYKSDYVFFLTDSQMGYASGVDGIMTREKPATNFFMGMFWAESLVLAETGASTGAIQIAGTDAVTQLPFFITACDYTLIGEELYAASAYLSREPLLLGTLKGQDFSKVIIIAILIVFTVLTLVLKTDTFLKMLNVG